MKREIEFRGKTAKGEWVYGYHAKFRNYKNEVYSAIIPKDEETEEGYMDDLHPVIPETVGQYTGCKDKNGKRIFEYDIVELYDKNSNVRWKAVVVFGNPYGEYSWGWNLKYIGKKPCVNTDILCWVEMEETGSFCEVIGNIFDKEGEK